MIQVLNKRASTHPNWCEDNYWLHETEEKIYGAVLDGCSTGINSHFASTFVKYALEKAVVDWPEGSDSFLEYLPVAVLDKMTEVAEMVGLTDMNLLSTMLLFRFDKSTQVLLVKFFGDGVVFVNGVEHFHDENNIPQYLAYQMYSDPETCANYMNTRRLMAFEEVTDFSICSDGIHSFRNLKTAALSTEIPINFLIRNTEWAGQNKGLSKKFNILTERNKDYITDETLSWWDIQDDLTIIRYTG